MHHRKIEQLAAGSSPVHGLDPRVKLICAMAFVVLVTVLPNKPLVIFILPAAIVMGGLFIARLPWGFVLSRTVMVLPFVVLVAVFLPFTRGHEVVWTIGSTGLRVYREGLDVCLAVLARGCLAILAVGWLVFTTPFQRLLLAMRSMHVPRVVVVTLAFLFRYLDLLADQSLRVRRARSARAPDGTRRLRIRSTGGLIGRLLLRALDRADRVYRAMLSRGYEGEVRTLTRLRLRSGDVIFLMAFILLAAAAALFAGLAGGAP
ncbi:MAG TPA: cobalt ECF transporter T component CbiQ [Myxococcota bacterium]|nr:cobalt ECF transporter T component CbiQ [Myxococcota bacterium]